MELQLVRSDGLPRQSIISMNTGPSRQTLVDESNNVKWQSAAQTFQLSLSTWPLQIDVYTPFAKSSAGASIGHLDENKCCKVGLQSDKGCPAGIKFRVVPAKPQKMYIKNNIHTPVEAYEKSTAYLQRHHLTAFFQKTLARLASERPHDPYQVLARYIHDAAKKELSTDGLKQKVDKQVQTEYAGNQIGFRTKTAESPTGYFANVLSGSGLSASTDSNRAILPEITLGSSSLISAPMWESSHERSKCESGSADKHVQTVITFIAHHEQGIAGHVLDPVVDQASTIMSSTSLDPVARDEEMNATQCEIPDQHDSQSKNGYPLTADPEHGVMSQGDSNNTGQACEYLATGSISDRLLAETEKMLAETSAVTGQKYSMFGSHMHAFPPTLASCVPLELASSGFETDDINNPGLIEFIPHESAERAPPTPHGYLSTPRLSCFMPDV